MQDIKYILWHYICLFDDTSITYTRKSAKSRRIPTQSRLAVVKMGYHPPGGRRILALLDVLQRLMTEMDGDGRLSRAGAELHNRFFVGERSWFSDESEGRKNSPKTFTFPDPADPNGAKRLVCPWHGKVSTRAFRIHFEWPVSPPVRRLRIVYIGPHL